MKFFVILLAALYSALGWSACPPHELAEPSQVKLEGDAVMIVVHATAAHDERLETKRGIDEAVRFARIRRIPVIYLQDDTPEQLYFMEDCKPDYWVFSKCGEVRFAVSPSQLYIVGGHLELCLSAVLREILHQWAKQPARDLTVTYLMDAIYSNGKSIDPSDPFYDDFLDSVNAATHGCPGDDRWPKLSLLKAMGIIVRDDHDLAYLERILPRWDPTFPDSYRVALQLNHSLKKLLRPGSGSKPPTLTFHFVDSARNLAGF